MSDATTALAEVPAVDSGAREHVLSGNCWCRPTRDVGDLRLRVHNDAAPTEGAS